jgi:quinol monooxygenase YgiN
MIGARVAGCTLDRRCREEEWVIYTTGVWTVKPGSEDEFVRIWEQMAEGMSSEYLGVVPRLLRDLEHPSRFVSVAGPWRRPDQVAEALASERFQDARASFQAHLESIEVSTYELVAEVS